MQTEIESLTHSLAQQLRQRGEFLCTAESCTGGLIAKTCTDLAGSSDWFERGFVTYSNQAKVDMLGVEEQVLEEFGAVSTEVAAQMAHGALRHSRANLALAVTGIAGPGGGSEDKPVGLVCFGFAYHDQVQTVRRQFSGSRAEIREASLVFSLEQGLVLLQS